MYGNGGWQEGQRRTKNGMGDEDKAGTNGRQDVDETREMEVDIFERNGTRVGRNRNATDWLKNLSARCIAGLTLCNTFTS